MFIKDATSVEIVAATTIKMQVVDALEEGRKIGDEKRTEEKRREERR